MSPSPPGLYGARYARWLADLAEELEAASDLLTRLSDGEYPAGVSLGASISLAEVAELRAQVDRLRQEIRTLQLGRRISSIPEAGPERTKLIGWRDVG